MSRHRVLVAAAAFVLACACGCSRTPLPAPYPRASAADSTIPPPLSGRVDAATAFTRQPAETGYEDPGRIFLGARLGVNAGNGEPANDIPSYGAMGRLRVRGPWLIGVALDQATFDFENPAAQLDLPVASVVDAQIDATTLSIWGEYELRLSDARWRRIRPFGGVGVGVGLLSDDQVSGPLSGGGSFDIEVAGGTEIVPGVAGGVRIGLLRNLTFEAGLRFDYHFTDLEVHDNLGGGNAGVDDYPTYGVYAGVGIWLE